MSKHIILSRLDEHTAYKEASLYNVGYPAGTFRIEKYDTKPWNKRPTYAWQVVTYSDDPDIIKWGLDLSKSQNQD